MSENDHHGKEDEPDSGNSEEQNEEKKDHSTGDNKNLLEWIVFAVSLLLVTGALGYIGYQIYTDTNGPPDINVSFRHSATDSAPNRYHVRLDNRGGSTAESVLIEFQLQRGDSVLEKAELQLQYIPRFSSREGWVNFSTPPADTDSVTARVVSFKSPS